MKWEAVRQSAEYQLAERVLKAWEAVPVDDNGFGETVALARAYIAMVDYCCEALQRWIPVGERKPEPYVSVLIADTSIPKWVGPITAFWTGNVWTKDVTEPPLKCTHWMPLPPAPSHSAAPHEGRPERTPRD